MIIFGGIFMPDYQKIYTGKQVCCNCVYYRQHYGKRGDGYQPIYCGHCVYPRLKTRQPDQTCGNWKAEKEEPVSKG